MRSSRAPTNRYYLLILLTAVLCGWINAATAAQDETSEIAPLANQSLLLDISRCGKRLVTVGERGHVLLSDDNGQNWQQVVVPTRSLLTSVFFVDDKHGWAGGHDGVILFTQDAGNTWILQHHDQQYDDPVLDIWFRNPDEGFAIGAYGMFLSTSDGGQNWERRNIIEDDFHFNAITALADGELFIVAEQGHIYHSNDSGYTWEEIPSPYSGSFFGITPLGESELLVYGLRGHLYHSSDRGKTWQPLDTGTETSLMAAMRSSTHRIYVAGLGGTLLSSSENSTRFVPHTRDNRKALTALVEAPNQVIVLTGAAGVSLYNESDE